MQNKKRGFITLISSIEQLEVFGYNIPIQKGKRIYNISLNEAKISSLSNGCELPLKIKFSNGNNWSGISYFKDGDVNLTIQQIPKKKQIILRFKIMTTIYMFI